MPGKILNNLRFTSPDSLNETDFAGIHTRNGDSIAVHFDPPPSRRGKLTFGSSGGSEGVWVVLDFPEKKIEFHSSDWRLAQPRHSLPLPKLKPNARRVLTLEKTEGKGNLVKLADVRVFLDGDPLLRVEDIDILPELGVRLEADQVRVRRFVHKGRPSPVPEHFHLGGWQMLNVKSIRDNLASLKRGLEQAADAGVRLLVTPETSLTGLFPFDPVPGRTRVARAEQELRKLIRKTRNAPYLVVGFPTWERMPGFGRKLICYNASRLYDPDGAVVSTHAKIHSCEPNFWHGYRLHEFDVDGVPISMHICHDNRYPEVWTLPVMFGARLILHPANGGVYSASVDGFETFAKASTITSHAFHIHVNGGGGSFIVGPRKYDNLLAASKECRRDNKAFPQVGPPEECLLHARIRVPDAFGYWPIRSFRASEEVAAAYLNLYRAMGGRRCD